MAQEHVFVQVIRELFNSKLVTTEEASLLDSLVLQLEPAGGDINGVLREHPRLQLAAGYFAHRFEALRRAEEAAVEDLWHKHYKLLEGASKDRLTEAKVTASVHQTPEYLDRTARSLKLKYMAAQLGELHSAYQSRARMLEQISNNIRFAEKESSRESEVSERR